ncbi:MAG: bifunctional [glutamate--ammonia ligase]-adenylyl-L-tyrosine phosphorylase/[glutamate--ammonia-ligase] adenylyltransferase [Pseudomonadota bacterium]
MTTPAISAESLLQRTCRLSRYVSRLVEAEPALVGSQPWDLPFRAEHMRAWLAAQNIPDEAALGTALRRLRKHVMLRMIARDLNGLADFTEVVETTTALAETAIATASAFLHEQFTQRYGPAIGADSGTPQQLLVVGMGKLGGGELNASSDIDLVFVYPEDSAASGVGSGTTSLSNHEYFGRLARRLIALLAALSADGYVFRVDMRLRPYGDSGPLVSSFAMLEEYFITQGREWERYAWLKARVISGERGAELMQLVRPFVFRRHFDYGAFHSLRDLHAQIRREVARRDMDDNIKLGPGGIREIEFIAQVFQLIRGGRDAGLQVRATRAALAALAARKLLPTENVAELDTAYVFLRNLEHRLQYLDDQQTQTLPHDDDLALVAEAMNFADSATFLQQLAAHRDCVIRHFEAIFSAQKAVPATVDVTTTAALAAAGYRDAETLAQRLHGLRQSTSYQRMPAAIQARLDTLLPKAVTVAAAQPRPDQALERLLQLFEAIGQRGAYLALLNEYPQALDNVAKLVAASAWTADYLARHPILLDELLDPRALYEPMDWQQARAMLTAQLADIAGDVEREMDTLRHFKQAQTFRLVAQDLAGLLTLEKLSDHLSDLADLILGETMRLCWAALRVKHRDTPCFAIVGYGKLGGKELGYASDLDLVFLYQDDDARAPEIYARLAQRINTWLTSTTPAGVLYETDLRLRPDGAAGLLVSSIAAFADYQESHAWVWEHQALTRARCAAGDATVGQCFEDIRIGILRRPRDLAELRHAVLEMRAKMHAAHPNDNGRFDLKHDAGGIIDVEFMVQYLVLGHAHAHAALTANSGNLALLKLAAELGLIPSALAEQVRDAYRAFRRLQHALRLEGERYARVAPEEVAQHAQAVRELWAHLFG